jgi:hypothetical protein
MSHAQASSPAACSLAPLLWSVFLSSPFSMAGTPFISFAWPLQLPAPASSMGLAVRALPGLDSRLEGGVNRAKLKFTNINTTTSRVSVRNINESEREGTKQISSK